MALDPNSQIVRFANKPFLFFLFDFPLHLLKLRKIIVVLPVVNGYNGCVCDGVL